MKRLRVRDRVMTSHDTCTSGTSRVLTVVSLQRLKLEALILSPADYEMWSMIKFLNAQSIAPIEIHRQCVRSMATHLLQELSWGRVIIMRPIARSSRKVISNFLLHLKKFLSGHRQRFENDREAEMSHWLQS